MHKLPPMSRKLPLTANSNIIGFVKAHSLTKPIVGPEHIEFTPMWGVTPIKDPAKPQVVLHKVNLRPVRVKILHRFDIS